MILDCPTCHNQVTPGCKTCHGAGTLICRSHLEIFAIYCRAALRAQILDGEQLAPILPVALSLGLTREQSQIVYEASRKDAQQIKRILDMPGRPTYQTKHRLGGIRIVTHTATIVTIPS